MPHPTVTLVVTTTDWGKRVIKQVAIYIALLRGINVGTKNRIKMTELKRTFEAAGLNRVQTYIQSGNVLFESVEDETSLSERIEHKIEADFGFAVRVVLRTAEELKRIAAACPFTRGEVLRAEEQAAGAESLYVAFLPTEPSPEGIDKLKPFGTETEKYRIQGREVFLLFSQSIRNSRLATNLHKLGVPATVRNWKTISKLAALARTIQV